MTARLEKDRAIRLSYGFVWREDCLFPTTSWTNVAAAGHHSTGSPDALAKLCAAYWLLERGALAAARRERGKFRSFLLATVTNFLATSGTARSKP